MLMILSVQPACAQCAPLTVDQIRPDRRSELLGSSISDQRNRVQIQLKAQNQSDPNVTLSQFPHAPPGSASLMKESCRNSPEHATLFTLATAGAAGDQQIAAAAERKVVPPHRSEKVPV
ncbi:hypothetical protein Q7C36_023187 [Tachysurus vachellii]|uniref:Uncharacterized protein n=1 Tax=Tachysurus vachellii TaxID=175792 RepID=A0AA88ISP7_TACVA|nr:hypothetical protein Q7C36_023187 [Tachysurus vachellii]